MQAAYRAVTLRAARAGSRLQQAEPVGHGGRFAAAGDPEPAEDIRNVDAEVFSLMKLEGSAISLIGGRASMIPASCLRRHLPIVPAGV